MFSVIIPTFNCSETLMLTLSSLFSSHFPRKMFEVIIVDGGSTDATINVAKNFPTRIFLVKEKGAAAARNYGITQSIGSFICFTDSDCVVPRYWLRKILKFFSDHPNVDGVGGPLLPINVNKISEYSGKLFAEMIRFPTERREIMLPISVGNQLVTANCAFRRSALMEGKTFDESFYTSCEDVDLCWNLIKRGKRLVFNPEIKMFHIFPYTLRGLWKQYFKYGVGHSKLMKKYSSQKFKINYWNYLSMVKHLISTLLPTRCDRTLDAFRCFRHMAEASGRIWGSVRAGIFNI